MPVHVGLSGSSLSTDFIKIRLFVYASYRVPSGSSLTFSACKNQIYFNCVWEKISWLSEWVLTRWKISVWDRKPNVSREIPQRWVSAGKTLPNSSIQWFREHKQNNRRRRNINTPARLHTETMFSMFSEKHRDPQLEGWFFVLARKLSSNQENSVQNKRTLTLLFIVWHECSICGFYDFSITMTFSITLLLRIGLTWVLKAICQSSFNWL